MPDEFCLAPNLVAAQKYFRPREQRGKYLLKGRVKADGGKLEHTVITSQIIMSLRV
jgi:hypothetical protein